MKSWQLGVLGAALALMMTACPSGRGGNATSNFPIKAGDVWAVVFANSGGTVTVGFGLDGAPEYDDGDIYADFKTTNNVAGGFGYVLTQTGRFQASFVIDAAKRQNLSCFADNTGNLTSKVSGGVFEAGKRVADINCAFKRQ
jgi:hypothetical protein